MGRKYNEQPATFIEQHKSRFDLLIVTATEIEKQELHARLQPVDGEPHIIKVSKDKHTYYLGKFSHYNAIHVATGDMGSIDRAGSIVTTGDAIQQWKPKAVLMVGISFGADPKKVKIGDVLVAERVLNYENARINKDGSVENRGKDGPASSLLVNRFRSVDEWEYTVHHPTLESYAAKFVVGPVLSGQKLIDNNEFKQEILKREPTAIGGEMEGMGIYAACDDRVNHWILVKGVCDYADGKKGKNKQRFQELAIQSAVSLCEHVFSSPHAFDDIALASGSLNAEASAAEETKKKILEPLTRQLVRQLEKQKTSGKYIPGTFIEINDSKEQLRFFCHPILFMRKWMEELKMLDFSELNKVFAQTGHPPFSYDVSFMEREAGALTIDNFATRAATWLAYLTGKFQELEEHTLARNIVSTFSYKLKWRLEYFQWAIYQICVISEDAGQGKTNFICDLVDRFFIGRGLPAVFLLGTNIDPHDIRRSILAKVYPDHASKSFADFLADVKTLSNADHTPFTIIIDGINETSNPSLMSANLESFLEEVTEHPFIKVIITCRTEYYQKNFANLDTSVIVAKTGKITGLRPFGGRNDRVSEKLFWTYMDHFKVSTTGVSGKVYEQLVNNFLLLRIFCESYQGEQLGSVPNIYKQELFEKYYRIKAEEINRRLNQGDELKVIGQIDIRNFIENIIKYMVANEQFSNIPLDSIITDPANKSIYVRFLDENILIRRDPAGDSAIFDAEVINFTYDEFRDFLLSEYLIAKVYPTDPAAFTAFISQTITAQSAILEGCGTFLFYRARRTHISALRQLIEDQAWFPGIRLRCLFTLEDKYITPDDVSFILSEIRREPTQLPRLFFNFLHRSDYQIFLNLNLQHFLEYLRELPATDFDSLFVKHFHTNNFNYAGIRQDSLIDNFTSIIDADEMSPTIQNSAEILLYLFVNERSYEIKRLYERFHFKYPEVAKAQLRRGITAKCTQLVETIKRFCRQYDITL